MRKLPLLFAPAIGFAFAGAGTHIEGQAKSHRWNKATDITASTAAARAGISATIMAGTSTVRAATMIIGLMATGAESGFSPSRN
ncbi:hypothetical protein [Bosea beijingensis]|uniref:hypothetical protein n=1 Tax=Bosea beijingensis TaxID=3068632 RepID=UPI0027426233|nr:hypothetical protein [Bosea sp. REN20]